MHLFTSYVDFISFDDRDAAMASITERAQRMEKELRETNAKHDRSAAELQVSFPNVRGRVRACVRVDTRVRCARVDTHVHPFNLCQQEWISELQTTAN